MTDRYAVLLFAAMVAAIAAGVAALLAAVHRRRQGSAGAADGWPRLARGACYLSLALLLLSVIDHIIFGHAPGSSQALAPLAFVREHVAIVVIGTVAAGLLWWVRPRKAA